ncbi:MAG: hypothetical protein WCQ41_00630 [Bacillota bacterium]
MKIIKRINSREVVYLVIIVILAVMAVVSVSIFTLLNINKIKPGTNIELQGKKSEKLNALLQDKLLKQSTLENIFSIYNGITDPSISSVKSNRGDYYTNIKVFSFNQKIDYSLNNNDDSIQFEYKKMKVLMRLGSSKVWVGEKLISFDLAPTTFNGELFLPNTMVEYFYKLFEKVFTHIEYNEFTFLNVFSKSNFGKLSGIYKSEGDYYARNIYESNSSGSILLSNKNNEVLSLVSFNIASRKMIFITKSNSKTLSEIINNKFTNIKDFPDDAELSNDEELVYWQDGELLQIYDILKKTSFALPKKDFQNGVFENIFGVGKLKIIGAKYSSQTDYSVDFVDSSLKESTLVKRNGNIQLISDIIVSPSKKYFIWHTQDGYEVVNKSSLEKVIELKSAGWPVWISKEKICFIINEAISEVDLSNGATSQFEQSISLENILFGKEYLCKMTNDFAIFIQKRNGEVVVKISKNTEFPDNIKEIKLLLNSESNTINVKQFGGNNILISDSSRYWLINIASGELYFSKINEVELGYLF